MVGPRPLFDPVTGSLDTQAVFVEAVPLAKLLGFFALLSAPAFALSFLTEGTFGLGLLFGVLGQFVLALGVALTVVYAVARGVQLAEA